MRDLKDQQFIKELLEKVNSAGDKQTLVRVVTDHSKALKALHAESTVTNRKNFLAAEAEYLKNVGEIAARYFPEDDLEEVFPQSFKNKKAVYEHLAQVGTWQIGRSQFYEHCKQGLLRPGADGQYQLKAVEKYAKTWLKALATGQKVNEKMDRLQERKLEAETRAAELRHDRERFELDAKIGRFIPRDQFELAVVGRAVAYMAHLSHMVHTEAADWIDIVGGDQARAPELVAAVLRTIEQRMSDFAADAEFEVIFEANE